jgi:predicted RNA-binding Zn ribbon-like protein
MKPTELALERWRPASEPLAVRFMNTRWADHGSPRDNIESIAGLSTWLSDAVKAKPPGISPSEHQDFVALRDALRVAAAFATSDPRPNAEADGQPLQASTDLINITLTSTPMIPKLRIEHAAFGLTDVRPLTSSSLRSDIARDALDQLTSGKVRACLAPRCVLYFVKNHPRREWCGPGCGNRARANRHYQRHLREPAS